MGCVVIQRESWGTRHCEIEAFARNMGPWEMIICVLLTFALILR